MHRTRANKNKHRPFVWTSTNRFARYQSQKNVFAFGQRTNCTYTYVHSARRVCTTTDKRAHARTHARERPPPMPFGRLTDHTNERTSQMSTSPAASNFGTAFRMAANLLADTNLQVKSHHRQQQRRRRQQQQQFVAQQCRAYWYWQAEGKNYRRHSAIAQHLNCTTRRCPTNSQPPSIHPSIDPSHLPTHRSRNCLSHSRYSPR